MNLSANFTLKELTKSDTATRLGIDNTPDEAVIESLRLLCENILQPVRDHFGKPVKISSGYRSPELNSSPAVGGSKTSDHCKGQAVDFEIDGLSNPDVAQWIMDNLTYSQLILEFYVQGEPNSGWIHCSYNPEKLIKQELTAVKVAGKTQYLNGLQA